MRAAIAWIHIEKDSRNNDNVFLQALAEEAHSVVERFWQSRQVCPNIKRTGRFSFDADIHLPQAAKRIIALLSEVFLDGQRFLRGDLWIEKRGSNSLERVIGAAIEK